MTVNMAVRLLSMTSTRIMDVSSIVTSLKLRLWTRFWSDMCTTLLGWSLTSFLYQATGILSWDSSTENSAVSRSFTVTSLMGFTNSRRIPEERRMNDKREVRK